MAIVQSLPSTQQLVEQLPGNTQRYDNKTSTPAASVVIPSGSLDEQRFNSSITAEVPENWHCCYNPAEGQVHIIASCVSASHELMKDISRPYYRNADLQILTESNITKPHVLDRVVRWNDVIASFASQSNRRDYDAVLQVSENEGEGVGTCSYYLVDYNSEVVFWFRDVSTTVLGLPESLPGAELLLSEQFWVHCEYMPSPHRDFTPSAKELLATLGTMYIDASSSTGSVSPFHQDECESYSRALTQVLSTGNSIEINWCLARLRSLLTQSRIINLFGEPNARTDRNVIVNGQKAPPVTTTFAFLSVIMFGIPSIYLARWNSIWVDRVTYTREWKRLSKDMIDEYLYALFASGILLIASSTLLGLASSTIVHTLAAVAIVLALCGGCYAASLFSTLRTLGTCAADAANFIQINEHITTGLQRMAVKHSIPWALIVWSGLCIFISGLWEISGDMIKVLHQTIRLSGKDMMVPALIAMTYLYGRGYFSFTRLYAVCSR